MKAEEKRTTISIKRTLQLLRLFLLVFFKLLTYGTVFSGSFAYTYFGCVIQRIHGVRVFEMKSF